MNKNLIQVFLGGYVNSQNAQNNNCRSLSEHLDKQKFEVWTMITWYGYPKDNDFQKKPAVHYIHDTPSPWTEKLHLPYWLFAWVAYAIGIFKCDVAFLPKGEYDRFCCLWARVCRCKVFKTLEGVIDEALLQQARIEKCQYVSKYKCYEPRLYSITQFIADRERKDNSLIFSDKVLYLGVDSVKFLYTEGQHGFLQNIIFIGFSLVRKRASEFIRMAKEFPNVLFHIVGGNTLEDGVTVEDYIKDHHITNILYHGSLDHSRLSELLKSMDLMYFPSRSEGFPKVMLETACAGVPTLCYSDYGADEWITTGKDGFVVNTFEEAKAVIQSLIDHPEQLQQLSKNAIELGKRFDWKVLVKDWEEEIIKMVNEK